MDKAIRIITIVLAVISYVFSMSVLIPIEFIYCCYYAIIERDREYLDILFEETVETFAKWRRFILYYAKTGEVNFTYFE